VAYASGPYTEAPYDAGVVPNTTPPGQVLPPPIPGATTKYTWLLQPGVLPYGVGSWSGGAAPVVVVPGGILITPNPDAGTMSITCWWANQPALQVIRINPDGTRVPVRAAAPLAITTPTRVNYCTNPSANAGLNGYTPGAGSPALTQITRSDTGGPAWRATIAAAGTDEVVIPHALPGGTATIGLDLRLSARPTAVTITVGWVDVNGVALTASTATLTGDAVNASINQFARQVVAVTAPAGAAAASTVKLAATGLPAAATMDGAAVTIEQGATTGSPIDGDMLGGTWQGTPELSTSLLAPVQTVIDGEAPLDVPLVYEVYAPSLIGGRARSAPATLASNNATWLTHPAAAAAPVRCAPTLTPTLARKITQGVFAVIGRANPVVVSATVRTAPAGTLTFAVESFADRDTLLGLFADGSALLLRPPGDYGYGPGMWIALGDVTEDPQGRPAWMPVRELSAPFQVVDPPAGPNSLAA
jgi:hypothetical protein